MTSVKLIKSRDCFCRGQLSRLVHVVYHIPRFDLKDCNCYFLLIPNDLEHTYTQVNRFEKCSIKRNTRCRIKKTVPERRPQTKQVTISNGGGGYKTNGYII